MNKTILSQEQVQELIKNNLYKVNSGSKFLSRCIDGRYKNEDNLAPQAFPGADLGELALILATGRHFGFEVDKVKAVKSLISVLGNEDNFYFHSDAHADPKIHGGGCGHFKQMNLDPEAYFLGKDDLDFIKESLGELSKKGAKETILEGDHNEGAILVVKGPFSVQCQSIIDTNQGRKNVSVFVYHQTLTDEKHRELAKKLLETKAVTFKHGEDVDYLYQVLSETAENHLMETAKRLAPELPIYQVQFSDDGSFSIIKT